MADLEARQKEAQRKYHAAWDEVNALSLEIQKKREEGKTFLRLARKMAKFEKEASAYRMQADVLAEKIAKEKGKKGGSTRRAGSRRSGRTARRHTRK